MQKELYEWWRDLQPSESYPGTNVYVIELQHYQVKTLRYIQMLKYNWNFVSFDKYILSKKSYVYSLRNVTSSKQTYNNIQVF